MTWINHSPADDPPRQQVVPAPREIDAIGAVLATAFGRPPVLPADWTGPLHELDRTR